MNSIDEALKSVPVGFAPKLEFDGGVTGGVARCCLYSTDRGISIGALSSEWAAYADEKNMPEAIEKAVANLLEAKSPTANDGA